MGGQMVILIVLMMVPRGPVTMLIILAEFQMEMPMANLAEILEAVVTLMMMMILSPMFSFDAMMSLYPKVWSTRQLRCIA